MSYDKYRHDEDFQNQLKEIKAKIDSEYIDNRFELPKHLTKEKCLEIIKRKE